MIFRFICDGQHGEVIRDEQQDHIWFLSQFYVAIIIMPACYGWHDKIML